ncbi:hypothetical protein WR25_05597 [Diploscapter pachys]|uniref:Probable imidazolonepropionase n=1 Tax=Diploscapter pachys TaxID=2018661 RepID=A0A2A2LTS1_9BILA|nr:hypothetical protein WR25_05597 [Diploscapter pachys]
MHYKLLVKGLKQIVQITDQPDVEFLKGEQMKNIKVLNSANNDLCVLTAHNGTIFYVGDEHGLEAFGKKLEIDKIISTNGGVLIPGFIDGHSHPVFAGDRVHEFAMKLAGATYMEVQAAGGGIIFTTSHTKEASEDQLLEDFVNGANEEDQTKLIVQEMIPKIREEKNKGKLQNLENIDVFCEKGVFGVESTREILKSGQSIGLYPNFHAEELNYIGGVEMGAEIRARAMSHLEEISDAGIEKMAEAGSVAVLLPSTAFILRLKPPPARKMIEKGVIVALGSDFNPNAFCLAMPMIMHFACVTMHLSMPEALVAATINSAHSLGRGRTHGAIAAHRQADFVLLEANSWEHIIYRIAGHEAIISKVFKKGELVYSK